MMRLISGIIVALCLPFMHAFTAVSSPLTFASTKNMAIPSSSQRNMIDASMAFDVMNHMEHTSSAITSSSASLLISETEPWVQPFASVLGPFLNIFSFAMASILSTRTQAYIACKNTMPCWSFVLNIIPLFALFHVSTKSALPCCHFVVSVGKTQRSSLQHRGVADRAIIEADSRINSSRIWSRYYSHSLARYFYVYEWNSLGATGTFNYEDEVRNLMGDWEWWCIGVNSSWLLCYKLWELKYKRLEPIDD